MLKDEIKQDPILPLFDQIYEGLEELKNSPKIIIRLAFLAALSLFMALGGLVMLILITLHKI